MHEGAKLSRVQSYYLYKENKSMYKCKYCGKEFEKPQSLSAHLGHCEMNPNRKIRSREDILNSAKKSALTAKKNRIVNDPYRYLLKQFALKCEKCGQEYEILSTQYKIDKGEYKRFCSKKCAHSRVQTTSINLKRSLALKGRSHDDQQKHYICKYCGASFLYKVSNSRLYCCPDCKNKYLVEKVYPKMGGYREASGRSKHGYYKGIKCDSVYELSYLIYNLDHNIDIKRCSKVYEYSYNGKRHKYYPDFEIEGTIIEIKGYYSELVDIKANAVNDMPIKILYKEDIQHCINYVMNKYGLPYSKLHNLYDK